jgi:hypothetical protein
VRRFAAIVTIAAVVLAMTAGPAFASACAATGCGPAMACSQLASPTCPMRTGAPTAHTSCPQPMDHGTRDAVSVQPARATGLAGTPFQAATDPVTHIGCSAPLFADARGAPHLTAVIRI